MTTLGKFIRQRRKELGLLGREVAVAVRKADGSPISIPYLVDLEHDHRKPSDSVLNQLSTVLRVDADVLFFLAGRRAPDLRLGKVDVETLRDELRTLRRNLDSQGGPL
jgi:transcriptional regulator with XRE-family HTH domain